MEERMMKERKIAYKQKFLIFRALFKGGNFSSLSIIQLCFTVTGGGKPKASLCVGIRSCPCVGQTVLLQILRWSKAFPTSVHTWGIFQVWISWCAFRYWTVVKPFPESAHEISCLCGSDNGSFDAELSSSLSHNLCTHEVSSLSE